MKSLPRLGLVGIVLGLVLSSVPARVQERTQPIGERSKSATDTFDTIEWLLANPS